MSIIADIKQAKALYEDHIARHKCRYAVAMIDDGLKPCETRADLLREWCFVAGRWGQEPDDDRRQREHFNRNLRPAAAL